MLNINVTITNRPKSQLKQSKNSVGRFTELWAVLDICVGRFGCSCGPFLTKPWAVLDQDYGPFWSFPVQLHSSQLSWSTWYGACLIASRK